MTFLFVGCTRAIWASLFSWHGLFATQCQLLHLVSMDSADAFSNGLGRCCVIVSLCTHCRGVHMSLEASKSPIICLCIGSHLWCLHCPVKASVVVCAVHVVNGHSVGTNCTVTVIEPKTPAKSHPFCWDTANLPLWSSLDLGQTSDFVSTTVISLLLSWSQSQGPFPSHCCFQHTPLHWHPLLRSRADQSVQDFGSSSSMI